MHERDKAHERNELELISHSFVIHAINHSINQPGEHEHCPVGVDQSGAPRFQARPRVALVLTAAHENRGSGSLVLSRDDLLQMGVVSSVKQWSKHYVKHVVI